MLECPSPGRNEVPAPERIGISLSELYTTALAAYVATYQADDITKKLDEVYESEPFTLEPEMVRFQVASIGAEQW